jgi:hypothetical protein
VQDGVANRLDGTASVDRQKQMSGLEFVRGLVDGTLPLNTLAETLGYDVTEVVSERVVVTVTPAMLLDSCMGLAIQEEPLPGRRGGISGAAGHSTPV